MNKFQPIFPKPKKIDWLINKYTTDIHQLYLIMWTSFAKQMEQSLSTVRIMFEARGYTMIGEPCSSLLNRRPTIELHAEHIRNEVKKKIVCLWIPLDPQRRVASVGKQDLQLYCEVTICDHLLLLTTNISFQAVSFLNQSSLYFEVLNYTDLVYPKINHCYVPHYTKLTEEAIVVLENKYGPRLGFNKMIAKTDAMARFLDFRPGEVVSIDKFSTIAGISTSYRYIIAPTEVM